MEVSTSFSTCSRFCCDLGIAFPDPSPFLHLPSHGQPDTSRVPVCAEHYTSMREPRLYLTPAYQCMLSAHHNVPVGKLRHSTFSLRTSFVLGLVLNSSREFPHQPSVWWGKVHGHRSSKEQASQAGSPQVSPGAQLQVQTPSSPPPVSSLVISLLSGPPGSACSRFSTFSPNPGQALCWGRGWVNRMVAHRMITAGGSAFELSSEGRVGVGLLTGGCFWAEETADTSAGVREASVGH